MAAALHTSTTTVAGALTCSVLASAAAAVPVGRWLDRHGGRALMTSGSIAATVLIVAGRRYTMCWLCMWSGPGSAWPPVRALRGGLRGHHHWFRERRGTALLA